MAEPEINKKHDVSIPAPQMVRHERHKLFLEALRHREQEVFQYLIILGPGLGGFVWLLVSHRQDTVALCASAIGLMLLFFVGSFYTIALGYNYRYLTFQIAKEEDTWEIRDSTLDAWPRTKSDWLARTRLSHYFRLAKRTCLRNCPWCFPPELIAVFWWAFVGGIMYIAIATWVAVCSWAGFAVFVTGIVILVMSLLIPCCYGAKLRRLCLSEK